MLCLNYGVYEKSKAIPQKCQNDIISEELCPETIALKHKILITFFFIKLN